MLKFSIKNLIENNVSNNVSNSGSTSFNLNNLLNLNEVKESKIDSPITNHHDSLSAHSQNLLMNFNEYQKFILSKFQSSYATQSYQNSLFQIQSNQCYHQNINRLWLYRLSQRYLASNVEFPSFFYNSEESLTNNISSSSPVLNLSASFEENSKLQMSSDKEIRKRCNSDGDKSESIRKKLKPLESENLLCAEKDSKRMSDEMADQKNSKPKTFPCTECGKVRQFSNY